MSFRVLHHNRCFDGACSAALFTRLHQQCLGGAPAYEYVGLEHGPAGPIPASVFGPAGNAIVDFKYSPAPELTWWFDHHQSAFLTPADRAHFDAQQPSATQFFDPTYVSCTGLIAHVGRTHFGFDTAGLEDFLHWADVIDGARFESAQAAVEMRAPAMQLALVIENASDPQLIPGIIALLPGCSFAQVLERPFVQRHLEPLWRAHQAAIKLVRSRAELADGVVFFDLTDQPVEGLSKFIPYFFYPQATYTIAVTRSASRVKLSVGTNPWTSRSPQTLVNLAAICERFGGGGHARVGAVSFPLDQLAQARAAAATIVEELRAAERATNPVLPVS